MTPQDIARRRDRYGISRAELADILAVEESDVKDWETGKLAIPALLEPAMQALVPDQRTPKNVEATVWRPSRPDSAVTAKGTTFYSAIWTAAFKLYPALKSKAPDLMSVERLYDNHFIVQFGRRAKNGKHRMGPIFETAITWLHRVPSQADRASNESRTHE